MEFSKGSIRKIHSTGNTNQSSDKRDWFWFCRSGNRSRIWRTHARFRMVSFQRKNHFWLHRLKESTLSHSGPDEQMVNRAKELADDLLIVVREEWAKTKAVNEGYTLPSSGGAGYPAAAGFGQQQQYPGYSMGGQPPLPGSMAPPPYRPSSLSSNRIFRWNKHLLNRPPGSAPPPPPGGALDDDWQPPASVNSTPEQKAYWAQILAK